MHIFDRLSLGPAAEIAGARPLGNGAGLWPKLRRDSGRKISSGSR
jgi:hypothetical protein